MTGTATQPGRVVVVGSINVDLFARVARHPRPGETVLGSGGSTRPGGKGANQAVAAALAGAPTVMVGAVGDDAPSTVGLSLLEKGGVDLAHVHTAAGVPTGVALITVAGTGENSIIVIPGANDEVSPGLAREDLSALTATTRDVVVLQGEIPVETVDEVARACTGDGVRVIVNLAPVVDLAPETLRSADPLVVNEHEARAADRMLTRAQDGTGGRTDDPSDSAGMTVENATDLAARIIGHGVASVVITLGEAGAVVAGGEGTQSIAAEKTEVVDTTGAGDCFVGTLAARLLAGDSLADAACAGNHAAAGAVGAEGAQESYPGWAEHN